MKYYHTPVLMEEVLDYLKPKSNENFVDCTVGLAGHAEKILSKISPRGRLLGIDQNQEGISEAKKKLEKYKNRTIFVHDNFRHLNKIIGDQNFSRVAGIFFDLGLASWQIDDSKKGLSFSVEAPLDMRLSDNLTFTAADIVNRYPEKQLANLFYQYGDVRGNRQLARKIIQSRGKQAIKTTSDLVKIIASKNPKILAPIFQALRIEVNQELENLTLALPQALEILKPKGRIVVISYHSGEDRIVKNFFRSQKGQLKILTKKPVTTSREEIRENPRARSAKLRAAEKI